MAQVVDDSGNKRVASSSTTKTSSTASTASTAKTSSTASTAAKTTGTTTTAAKTTGTTTAKTATGATTATTGSSTKTTSTGTSTTAKTTGTTGATTATTKSTGSSSTAKSTGSSSTSKSTSSSSTAKSTGSSSTAKSTSSTSGTATISKVTNNSSEYAPTSDAATNSALWWKVQNDSTLTASQKTALQTALHDANVKINAGQTYDSKTGTWSGSSSSGTSASTATGSTNYTYTQGTYSTASNTGKTNESVAAIQEAINSWIQSGAEGTEGLSTLTVDGLYGANTKNAVIAYQRAKGITVDGIVGNDTAAHLGLLGGSGSDTTTNTTYDADREAYWDSAYDQYGSSNDFMAAAQNAYNAGDLEAAARIEYARNLYLESQGGSASGYDYTYDYMMAYEVPGTQSEVEYIGGYIKTYTFETIDGVTHTSATTLNGDPVESGTSILTDSWTDEEGNYYETYWTWYGDGMREDTGDWYTDTTVTERELEEELVEDFWSSEIFDYLNEQLETGEQAALDANEAATQESVEEIKAQLENGLAQYETDAAEAYLQMNQNQDNLVLQNAAAGNTGGIASKQYTASQSAYDSQLLAIALEREYFINTCNQTIAQLEAEGRYNEAQIISEWAQEKIEVINEAYEFYEQMALQEAEFEYEKETTDRNYAYQQAYNLMQQGIVTADTLETLGLDSEDAAYYANLINNASTVDEAEDILNTAYELGGTSGSGGTGGTNDNDTGGTDYSASNLYTQMFNAGVSTAALAYAWLQENTKCSATEIESLVTYYISDVYPELKEKADAKKEQDAASDVAKAWEKYDSIIANSHSASANWIAIPGLGRVSIQELDAYVANGTVIETKRSDGTYYYSMKE